MKSLEQLSEDAHRLCIAIENLPAGSLQTHISIIAAALAQDIRDREHNQVQGTEARICADIAARQQFGIKKYGVSVEANPLPLVAWLEHAYFEALDHAVYLKRAMEEVARNPQSAIRNPQ